MDIEKKNMAVRCNTSSEFKGIIIKYPQYNCVRILKSGDLRSKKFSAFLDTSERK